MKTTLNIGDDLYRKAKARAAIQGKSLGRFLEESLERMLRNSADEEASWSDWAAALPEISKKAAQDLNTDLTGCCEIQRFFWTIQLS